MSTYITNQFHLCRLYEQLQLAFTNNVIVKLLQKNRTIDMVSICRDNEPCRHMSYIFIIITNITTEVIENCAFVLNGIRKKSRIFI